MRKNSLTDFVEEQEILNNIQTSIRKIYCDDEELDDEDYLSALTSRTLEVINYMDKVHEELVQEPGIINVAEEFETSADNIAKDIIEILMFSTIARQKIVLEQLLDGEQK